MKKLIIVTLFPISAFAGGPLVDIDQSQDIGQTSTNNFDSENRGSISYSFPNVSRDSYGGGVSCSKPTMGAGIYGRNNDDVGGALMFAVPLDGKKCKEFVELREQEMMWEAVDKAAQRIRNCELLHHAVTVDLNADSNIARLQAFCDGIKVIHEDPDGQPEAGRISSHNK